MPLRQAQPFFQTLTLLLAFPIRHASLCAVETNNPCPKGAEPKPGQWLAPEDFANVIRLTPLISIDVIVRSPEGRVLVGRRVHEPCKHLWFVPGSRITKNERLAEAFRRVTREELGVEKPMSDARFLGVFEHMYPVNRFEQSGYGTHYIVLAYELALSLEPASLPKDQHGEYAWLTVPEIMSRPDVHENTKAYFRA